MYDANGPVASGPLASLLMLGLTGQVLPVAVFARAGFDLIAQRCLWQFDDLSKLLSVEGGSYFKTHAIPVLKERQGLPDEIMVKGHRRYYPDVVYSIFGKQYYLTKEWFVKAYDVLADYFLSHGVTLKEIADQVGRKEEVFMYSDKLGPIQQIVYGAPGTGKSFSTEGRLMSKAGGPKAVSYRTTFHPDSDYSTFVGTYKPTMKDEKIVYSFRPQAFMNAYVSAWQELLKGSGGAISDTYDKTYTGFVKVMVDTAAAFIAESGKGVEKTRQEIIAKAKELSHGEYAENSFVPTDFCYNRVNVGVSLKRPPIFEYKGNGLFGCIGAGDKEYSGDILWRQKGSEKDVVIGKCVKGVRTLFSNEPTKPVVLIIEEINRGNCAQIFGDLFQLLDRSDDGWSTYPIEADGDLSSWLSEPDQFDGGLTGIAMPDSFKKRLSDEDWKLVLKGEKLVLPPNLHIWATMNTSDQSLFPIDSAFKRRWDWKYVPITNHTEEAYVIKIGNDAYDWWSFLTAINKKIWDATDSEDKKLGYFFVKAKKIDGVNVVDADKFLNKVIFYLWNDVFKNSDPEKAFKFQKPNGANELATFHDFFNPESGLRDDEMLKAFLKGLGVKTQQEELQSAQVSEQNA